MLEWSCTFCSCFFKVLLSDQCLKCFQLKKIWMIICFKGFFPMLLQSYVLWYKKPCKFQWLSFSVSSVAVDFWLRSISCLLAFWQRAFSLFLWCHHCLLTMFVYVFWEVNMYSHFLCYWKVSIQQLQISTADGELADCLVWTMEPEGGAQKIEHIVQDMIFRSLKPQCWMEFRLLISWVTGMCWSKVSIFKAFSACKA